MTAQERAGICILGLGYIGLPLAVEFQKHPTFSFDIRKNRIAELFGEMIVH